MCRFLVYIGKEPILMADLMTRPKHSIIQQSWDSKEILTSGPLNGDGFGIGWYAVFDPTACIFTCINPAWNNLNLRRLAEKIKSPLIFAHVRAASPGLLINEANCHPFQFGRFMWMHNGCVGGFKKIKKQIIDRLSENLFNHIQGTTDSEYSFMLFLSILFGKEAEEGSHTESTLGMTSFKAETLRETMIETIHTLIRWKREKGVEERSFLNFAISDGKNVIVTRFIDPESSQPASLYYASGTRYEGNNGEYHMIQARRQQCYIVASEPLTREGEDKKDWIPVPKNHVITITDHFNLLLHPIPPLE
ncbi:glutamine amidotransferase subunit [Balamuthia mandrillaris]